MSDRKKQAVNMVTSALVVQDTSAWSAFYCAEWSTYLYKAVAM